MVKKLLSLLLIAAFCLALLPASFAEEINIVEPVGDGAPAPCHPERSEAEPKDLSEDSSSLSLLRMTDETNEIVASGECGENLTWTLDDEGTLTISGTGDMWDYDYADDLPWYGGNESINTIAVSVGVTSISACAFYECSSLTSVTIPSSVTSIGDHAFAYCNSLTNVIIPDCVTRIADYTFYRCSNLTSVTIPNSIKIIDDRAFSYCSSLTSVTIPDSVTSIGNGVFSYSGLTSLKLPSSLTFLGSNILAGTEGVTELTIPKGLKEVNYGTTETPYLIDNGPLVGSYVKILTFQDDTTAIVDGLAYCSRRLESVVIPDSVTSIGNSAFTSCSSLTNVTIPDSVTSIGEAAFSGCSSLTSVTIGNSVKGIGNFAFSYCSSLTEVFFRGAAPTIGMICFYDVTATAHYPSDDPSWTEDVMQDYGGNITWEPYTPEGYELTVTDYTNGGATADLSSGIYSGSIDFTVSSTGDQAVAVIARVGSSYTVLPCTDKDGCHCFTLNVTEDTELVLVYKGNVDFNGKVALKDNLMVKKHIARSALITDPLALLVADVDGNGEIKLKDNLMIKKHIAKSQMLEW